jgi:chlorobactene glucosyltransferase
MQSFWERLILPHIFALITARFHDMSRVNRTRNPRHVIANGQFMLVRRDAYDEIGGHEALRGDVVEDQRLAQRLVAAGHRIFIGHGAELMETRMYRSLGGIIEGWTKNLALGSRRAAPPVVAPAVPWLIAALLLLTWVVPPAVLTASLFVYVAGGVVAWALATTSLSLLFWLVTFAGMGVPPLYALGYPLGAAATAALFVRSALRGGHVEWKGRAYDVET